MFTFMLSSRRQLILLLSAVAALGGHAAETKGLHASDLARALLAVHHQDGRPGGLSHKLLTDPRFLEIIKARLRNDTTDGVQLLEAKLAIKADTSAVENMTDSPFDVIDDIDFDGDAKDVTTDVVSTVMEGFNDGAVMIILLTIIIGLVGVTFVEQIFRAIFLMNYQEKMDNWLWPVVVMSTFTMTTTWLYHVATHAAETNSTFFVLRCLLAIAVGWWGLNFYNELYVNGRPVLTDKTEIVARDVYMNLTEAMFDVIIRFFIQTSLMLLLVFQAQSNVQLGHPAETSQSRRFFNFAFALALQLFLWARQGSTWEELRRLRLVRFVQYVDPVGRKRLIQLPGSEYYIRYCMSILTNGIFYKFLILAYPLFVFTNFGLSSGQQLVREAVSITLVLSLDNLAGSRKFVASVQKPGDGDD